MAAFGPAVVSAFYSVIMFGVLKQHGGWAKVRDVRSGRGVTDMGESWKQLVPFSRSAFYLAPLSAGVAVLFSLIGMIAVVT